MKYIPKCSTILILLLIVAEASSSSSASSSSKFIRTKRRKSPLNVFSTSTAIATAGSQLNILSIRAGGIKNKAPPSSSTKVIPSSSLFQRQKVKNGVLLIASTVTLYCLWYYRTALMVIFDKEKLQDTAVQTLQKLNDLPYCYSRSFYTIAMALWEMMGLSTIPVETAAGMVFGWSGFYWSAVSKLLGATLAFGLGRGALKTTVGNKLSSNTFLKLVQRSTKENPLLVVILIKLSCFPETVKNFGSSMLEPITWWMFVLATAVHGWTFTALWTYLGVDTAARLKDTTDSLPPDLRLQLLLTLALINGCVVSPLAMFYWMKTLKKEQKSSQARTSRNKKKS